MAADAHADTILIGCLMNLRACAGAAARIAMEQRGPVLVQCAGVKGAFALDDAYVAGRVSEALGYERSDAAEAAVRLARLGLPVFAHHVCSQAGEPKGFGEINVPITVAGQTVRPGDWIVGDVDGVVVLAADRLDEIVAEARHLPVEARGGVGDDGDVGVVALVAAAPVGDLRWRPPVAAATAAGRDAPGVHSCLIGG